MRRPMTCGRTEARSGRCATVESAAIRRTVAPSRRSHHRSRGPYALGVTSVDGGGRRPGGNRPEGPGRPGAGVRAARMTGGRIVGLDVARGLAVLGMFVAHVGPAGDAYPPTE